MTVSRPLHLDRLWPHYFAIPVPSVVRWAAFHRAEGMFETQSEQLYYEQTLPVLELMREEPWKQY